VSASGKHTVVAKNADGCETTKEVDVKQAPGAPSLEIAATDPTCAAPESTITVTTATTGVQYSLDGGSFAAYPQGGWKVSASGKHTVVAKNADGCETTKEVDVKQAPGAPSLEIAATDPTCAAPESTITVTTATTGYNTALMAELCSLSSGRLEGECIRQAYCSCEECRWLRDDEGSGCEAGSWCSIS
jgi:hypothetical protein